MRRSPSRAGAVAAIAILVATALAGCDPRSEPITPRGAGFRVTAAGDLETWFGGPCRDVVEVRLQFLTGPDDQDPVTYELRAPGFVPSTERPARLPAPGSGLARLQGLTLDRPVGGLEVTRRLPEDFDWRKAYAVDLRVRTTAGQAATYLVTKRLTEESGDHPGDYYVQDQGWFDRQGFAAAEGDGFLALCSTIGPG